MEENFNDIQVSQRLNEAAGRLEEAENASGGPKSWEERFRMGNTGAEVIFNIKWDIYMTLKAI